jgi:hypothetical protein
MGRLLGSRSVHRRKRRSWAGSAYRGATRPAAFRICLWYSMEFVLGGDLRSRIDRRKAIAKGLPPCEERAARAEVHAEFSAVVEAVAHLHRLRIVHRDVKPGYCGGRRAPPVGFWAGEKTWSPLRRRCGTGRRAPRGSGPAHRGTWRLGRPMYVVQKRGASTVRTVRGDFRWAAACFRRIVDSPGLGVRLPLRRADEIAELNDILYRRSQHTIMRVPPVA